MAMHNMFNFAREYCTNYGNNVIYIISEQWMTYKYK